MNEAYYFQTEYTEEAEKDLKGLFSSVCLCSSDPAH